MNSMTKSLSLILLAGSLFLQSLSAKTVDVAISIDPVRSHGVWEGWGTSLAWFANVVGDRDDIADLLFTTKSVAVGKQTLPGLGLNIVRYNAGACSGSTVDGRRMVVSKIIFPYRQMEGFWLDGKSTDPQSSSWNWSVDANQRAMMLKARDRGVDRFELFSNSPMWWMCANDNPSGAAKGSDDNLAVKHREDFAVYLASIARYAKDHWGITFTSVEPFNEPSSSFWYADCKQEGCHFSPQAQVAVLKALRTELDQRGLASMPIAASDEDTTDEAVAIWHDFDASTQSLVSQINVHGYEGERGRRDLLDQAAASAGKRLWNSEHGEGDGSGLTLARDLNLDFHALHPTVWCYWQPLDGGGWGLLPSDLKAKTIGLANPKYFVLAQYSRHIRPGMTILDTGVKNTVAAYDDAAHKLVLVTFNPGPARTISYDLSKFSVVPEPVASWLTEPEGQTRYAARSDLRLDGKQLTCAFPAKSIQTFEIEKVTRQ